MLASLPTLIPGLLDRFGHQAGRYISLEQIVERPNETYNGSLQASSRGLLPEEF